MPTRSHLRQLKFFNSYIKFFQNTAETPIEEESKMAKVKYYKCLFRFNDIVVIAILNSKKGALVIN